MTGPRKAKAQVHPLPVEEPDFKWRVRADLKQALNIPQDRMDAEPSTYVELGWKDHPSQIVEHGNKVFSVLIENSQFPDFNEQLLLHNPKDVTDASGFIEVAVMVKRLPDDASIGSFMIPIESLKPFQPLHLEMIANKQDDKDGPE